MAQINVLSKETIDKIAAGEVVERPSSVVKELMENAVDAGATAVTVEIKEGGISFIRVTDNGCGIERAQVPKAFLRHATSKIHSAEDLSHIASLGFRGEALSSIAAVARMEVITKTREELTGLRYQIEGGQETEAEEVGAPDGTTFLVRNLFFNTPVRKKFLKQPQTEGGYVSDLMEHMALANPGISFQYINNGQVRFHTSGNGNLQEIIYRIYGRDIASALIPIDAVEQGIHMKGFLGKPEINRANRNFEIYFVNGRFIKSNIIGKAIEEGYRKYVMQHKFPFAVLHFEINAGEIDVNVHPTKMEVRFTDQPRLYNFIAKYVEQTLHQVELIPEVTLTKPKEKTVGKIPAGTIPEPFEPKRAAKESPCYFSDPDSENSRERAREKIGAKEDGAEYIGNKKYKIAEDDIKKSVIVQAGIEKYGTITYDKKEEAAKKEAIEEDGIKEDAIKEDTAKEDAVKEGTAKEDAVKEDTAKEDAVKEDASKEDTIKKERITEDRIKANAIKKEGITGDGIKKDTVEENAENGHSAEGKSIGWGETEKNRTEVYGIYGYGTDMNATERIPAEWKVKEEGTYAAAPRTEDDGSEAGFFFVDRRIMPRKEENYPVLPNMQDMMQNNHLPRIFGTSPASQTAKYASNHANVLKASEHIFVEKSVQLDFFEEKMLTKDSRSDYQILGQIFNTYWLVAFHDKLFIIDQHAAHEKVKYENFIKHLEESSVESQMLNPPVIVTLTGKEEAVLKEASKVFSDMGFEIESFGGNEYALRSVPTDLYGCSEGGLFTEMLDELSEGDIHGAPAVIRQKIATMACKAAVKGNTSFDRAGIEALIDQLLTLEDPYHCPHGRPTIISMSKYEIEKKFKRIV